MPMICQQMIVNKVPNILCKSNFRQPLCPETPKIAADKESQRDQNGRLNTELPPLAISQIFTQAKGYQQRAQRGPLRLVPVHVEQIYTRAGTIRIPPTIPTKPDRAPTARPSRVCRGESCQE